MSETEITTRPRSKVIIKTDADFEFLNNKQKPKLQFRNSETPLDWKPNYGNEKMPEQTVPMTEVNFTKKKSFIVINNN